MDWPRTAAYLATAAVAVVAIVLARRERSHLAFAICAVWIAASDWLRHGGAMIREGAARPYVGLDRLSFHFDQVIVLSWSFALIALTLHYFTRIRPGWVLVPYALVFMLCLDYPDMRGEPLVLLYRSVALGACIVVWSAIIWAMLFRDDLQPHITHLTVMFLAASEVIISAVPFAGDFFRDWDMVRISNIVTGVACVVAQVWQLTRQRPRAEVAT